MANDKPSPAAAAYAQRMGARRANAPVAGGPAPPIPSLDASPHLSGMTPAQLAQQQRSGIAASPIFETEEAPQAQGVPIQPGDLLPPSARNDPAFRPGVGAMLAAENPHLVGKYGFLRNNRFYPPGSSEPVQQGKVRESTQQGLRAMQEAVAQASTTEEAAPPADTPEAVKEETSKARAALRFDEFDIAAWRDQMDNIFNRPEEAEAVEKRCIPVPRTDIIVQSSVRQSVPIVPGTGDDRLVVVYRTVTHKEDREIKKLISEQSKNAVVSESYLMDLYGLMTLTCALVSINDKPLHNHLDAKDQFDRDAFTIKFDKVSNWSMALLACLGAHYYFFENRIRTRLSARDIKNG